MCRPGLTSDECKMDQVEMVELCPEPNRDAVAAMGGIPGVSVSFHNISADVFVAETGERRRVLHRCVDRSLVRLHTRVSVQHFWRGSARWYAGTDGSEWMRKELAAERSQCPL